jgi:hypothetical protein
MNPREVDRTRHRKDATRDDIAEMRAVDDVSCARLRKRFAKLLRPREASSACHQLDARRERASAAMVAETAARG